MSDSSSNQNNPSPFSPAWSQQHPRDDAQADDAASSAAASTENPESQSSVNDTHPRGEAPQPTGDETVVQAAVQPADHPAAAAQPDAPAYPQAEMGYPQSAPSYPQSGPSATYPQSAPSAAYPQSAQSASQPVPAGYPESAASASAPGGYPQSAPSANYPPEQPGAFAQAAGAARGEMFNLKSLFDFGFSSYATPTIVKVVYIISIVAILGYWLSGVLFSFIAGSAINGMMPGDDGGTPFVVMGVLTLLFGWIPAIAAIAVTRMALELGLAAIRTSKRVDEIAEKLDRGDLGTGTPPQA